MTRPFVTIHYAQSLDARIDFPPAQIPLRLSSEEGLRLAHELRAAHDAVLVGIGTVLRDDPKLNVRRVSGTSPTRVVLDSQLRTPPDAQLLHAMPRVRTILLHGADAPTERAAALTAQGAELVACDQDASGQLNLAQAMHALHTKGIEKLLVEGGARVISAFLRQHAHTELIDELSVEICPLLLGERGLAVTTGFDSSAPLRLHNVRMAGLGASTWMRAQIPMAAVAG